MKYYNSCELGIKNQEDSRCKNKLTLPSTFSIEQKWKVFSWKEYSSNKLGWATFKIKVTLIKSERWKKKS